MKYMPKISGHFAKELNVDLLSSKYGLIQNFTNSNSQSAFLL